MAVRCWTLAFVLVLFGGVGCSDSPSGQPPATSETQIVMFEVSPDRVEPGGVVVVSWRAVHVGRFDGRQYCTLQWTVLDRDPEELLEVACEGSLEVEVPEEETAVQFQFSALRSDGETFVTRRRSVRVAELAVNVAPSSVTLPVNGTLAFTATVTGTGDASVSWSATCGSISGSGHTITYTAPGSPGSCVVRATSAADEGAWDEATVTVEEPDGSLWVTVTPVPGRITLSSVDGGVADETIASDYRWTLPPGVYNVAVEADGYVGQERVVSIGGQQTSTVHFTLAPVGLGIVGSVTIEGFVDEDGNRYGTLPESDDALDTLHLAAQMEELVGVAVMVRDEAGEPLMSAPITISVTDNSGLAVAVYPGRADAVASAGQPLSITTGSDGYAWFVFEAVGAAGGGSDASMLGDDAWPDATIIVSSIGDIGFVQQARFKTWFVNMSHLIYSSGRDAVATSPAEMRLDGSFVGRFTNAFELGETNEHWFGSVAMQKQPPDGPFWVGGERKLDGENRPRGFPGYMQYTIDPIGAHLVRWLDCPVVTNVDRTCIVAHAEDGAISLAPRSSVDLADLPVEAAVVATYFLQVWPTGPSGNPATYAFELKDYAFSIEWTAGSP